MRIFENKGCGTCYIIQEKGDIALLTREANGEFIVADGIDEKWHCWSKGHYFGNDLVSASRFYAELVTGEHIPSVKEAVKEARREVAKEIILAIRCADWKGGYIVDENDDIIDYGYTETEIWKTLNELEMKYVADIKETIV